jgi:hypothetical protein
MLIGCRAENYGSSYLVIYPFHQPSGGKIICNTNAKKGTKDAKDGTRNHFGGPRERENG